MNLSLGLGFGGLLGMANGVGDYNVTLQLSATTAGGTVITSPPFVVGISAVKSWEHTVTISDFNLPVGVHEPVMINPFGTDEYIQENSVTTKLRLNKKFLNSRCCFGPKCDFDVTNCE